MGFKEAKAAALKALAEGTYQTEPRGVGKNWIADDRLSVAEAIRIISGCRGVDARSTPHHQDQQIEVWVYRFGFGGPTEWERKLWVPEHSPAITVVVLPDLPAERGPTPANCPGPRYGFQVGMICDGIPAEYLAEKLLSRELPDDLAELEDEDEDDDPEAEPTPAQEARWAAQDEQRAAARALAIDLSDDLVEAARKLFGENVDYTSYSRKRAAEHQRRRFIKPQLISNPPFFRASILARNQSRIMFTFSGHVHVCVDMARNVNMARALPAAPGMELLEA